jgi:hypothetical protein
MKAGSQRVGDPKEEVLSICYLAMTVSPSFLCETIPPVEKGE